MQTPFITVDVTPSHPYGVPTILEISREEFVEFCRAPYIGDLVPEQFKNSPQFNGEGIRFWLKNPHVYERDYVPIGLTKKEYQNLLKEKKEEIQQKKIRIREARNRQDSEITMAYYEIQMDGLISQEKKIRKRIETAGVKFDGSKLERAKGYPIENLIEVKNGFAKCPLHTDKTPSMKIYPKQNKYHCFSCNKGGDSVDLCMAINNIPMAEAIKMLA